MRFRTKISEAHYIKACFKLTIKEISKGLQFSVERPKKSSTVKVRNCQEEWRYCGYIMQKRSVVTVAKIYYDKQKILERKPTNSHRETAACFYANEKK